jgi:transcriptional regulator with XRE-family HTH domain
MQPYITSDMIFGMWQVLYLRDAEAERQKLPPAERAAFDHAVERFAELDETAEEGITIMKLSDLRSAETVHREDMASDPDYRREYLRTSFANQVAIEVIRWRTEHGLTQTKLAEMLGMRQPNIARLEAGEHTPSLETLSRLSSGLDIKFSIGIDPEDGIYLSDFQPHGEPDADDSTDAEALESAHLPVSTRSLRRLRATVESGRTSEHLPDAEIVRRAALDLDEATYIALHKRVVDLLARLRQRRRPNGQRQSDRSTDVDVIFRDPQDGIIVFLAGFPGHRVHYLEIASGSLRKDPAASPRTE